MNSYYKKICTNLGMKLGNIKNKIFILFSIIKKTIPLLRTHKLFSFKPFNLKSKYIAVKHLPENGKVKKPNYSLVEVDIETISEKEFLGKEKKIDSDSMITLSNSNLKELTIIIKPPTT